MSSSLDRNGQPISAFINAGRRLDRDIAEMLGLAKGVLADGVVSTAEAELLRQWVAAHPDVVQAWPGNVLADRLMRVFEDGVVDKAEQRDLAELLKGLVGGTAGVIGQDSSSTELPLDDPPPTVEFNGSLFVLTGRFVMGPRIACQGLIAARGGECADRVTKALDYLVIGAIGSRDWIQSSHGRKIEKAVQYREECCSLAIISENHWAAALGK